MEDMISGISRFFVDAGVHNDIHVIEKSSDYVVFKSADTVLEMTYLNSFSRCRLAAELYDYQDYIKENKYHFDQWKRRWIRELQTSTLKKLTTGIELGDEV